MPDPRGQVQVFIATSLDGFIAGPNDELDWLPQGDDGMEDTYSPFMEGVGALLMGRRTFDVVHGFDIPWPYADRPVLVATSRPLPEDAPATVRAAPGDIAAAIEAALAAAAGKHVYLDGGALIRSALAAGLVHQLTITVVPVVLGAGRPLFSGTAGRHPLRLLGQRPIGRGLVELRYATTR